MMGSQAGLGGNDRGGPQLPGLENLGADAMVAGGITVDPNIPAGMEFIPSSVPDSEVGFNVASTGTGGSYELAVKSPCMTFEDYYAAFSKDSHPSLSVTPSAGRLDRRNGERKFDKRRIIIGCHVLFLICLLSSPLHSHIHADPLQS
jgi:hypothetical protein